MAMTQEKEAVERALSASGFKDKVKAEIDSKKWSHEVSWTWQHQTASSPFFSIFISVEQTINHINTTQVRFRNEVLKQTESRRKNTHGPGLCVSPFARTKNRCGARSGVSFLGKSVGPRDQTSHKAGGISWHRWSWWTFASNLKRLPGGWTFHIPNGWYVESGQSKHFKHWWNMWRSEPISRFKLFWP